MQIEIHDWARMLLLFTHIILVAFAMAKVLESDYRIIKGMITRHELIREASHIAKILLLLWLSGILIIYLDTGFSIELLASKSKLLIKLICVAVLTINGTLIHLYAMPAINSNSPPGKIKLILIATLGGVSSASWLLATFIGASSPLGNMSFKLLLIVYAMTLLLVITVSMALLKSQRIWIENLMMNSETDLEMSPPTNGDGNLQDENADMDHKKSRAVNKLIENKIRRFQYSASIKNDFKVFYSDHYK